MTADNEYQDLIEDLKPFFFQKPCLYVDIGQDDLDITKAFIDSEMAFTHLHFVNSDIQRLRELSDDLKDDPSYQKLRAHHLNILQPEVQENDTDENQSTNLNSNDSLSSLIPLICNDRISLLRMASHPSCMDVLSSYPWLLDQQMVDVLVLNVSVDDDYKGASYYVDVEEFLKNKGYSLFKVYQTKQITDWRKPYLEEVSVIYMSQKFIDENPSEWVYKLYLSETNRGENEAKSLHDWVMEFTNSWSDKLDLNCYEDSDDIKQRLESFLQSIETNLSAIKSENKNLSGSALSRETDRKEESHLLVANYEQRLERANIEIHSLKVAQKTIEAKLRDSQKNLLDTKEKLHQANLKYRSSGDNYAKMKSMYVNLQEEYKRFKKEQKSSLNFEKFKKALGIKKLYKKNNLLPMPKASYPLVIKKGIACKESFDVSGGINCEMAIEHNLSSAHPMNCVLASFSFFDEQNRRIEEKNIEGLTPSDSVGHYRYLNASDGQNKSQLSFKIPSGCQRLDMKVITWGYDGEVVIQKKPSLNPSTALKTVA